MGAEDDPPRYHDHCAHRGDPDDLNNLFVVRDPGDLNNLVVVKGLGCVKVRFLYSVHFKH